MPNGLDLFGFLATLRSIVATIASLIQQIFLFLFHLLQTAVVFLYNLIVTVALYVVRVFVAIGRFFRNLWEGVIKKGVLRLVDLLRRLRTIIDRYLGPVLRVLRKIRDILDKWYFKIFGPILNLIQQVRGILVIFRIFGLKWARRLDARLLRLESKLVEPFLAIRKFLNELATTINLVLDPELLLRHNVLLASLLSRFGALQRILGLGHDRPLTGAEETDQEQARKRFDMSRGDSIQKRWTDPDFLAQQAALRAELRREYKDITGREMTPGRPS